MPHAERVFFTTTRAIVGTLASFTELILYRDTEASFARQGPAWLKHSAKYRVTIMQTAKPGIYVLQSLAQEPLTNLSGCSQLLGSERWMEVARIAFPELRNLQDAEDQP